MLEGTFGNPQVFQEVPRTFEEQIKKVQKAAKRDLQRRYPWAFRRTPVIPRAYALPKRKKDFASGRPIVSFVDAFMRPLLEATSRLLHRICSLAFPRAFSKGDVYELLRQVREFFEFGTAEPLHCRNQDLAGFFNSISQSQFLLSNFTGRDMVPSRRPLFQSTLKNRHNNCASSGVDVALAPLVKSSFGARTYQPLYVMLSPCSIFRYPRETFANVSARPWAPRFRPLYAGWSLLHKRKSGGAHSTSAAPT